MNSYLTPAEVEAWASHTGRPDYAQAGATLREYAAVVEELSDVEGALWRCFCGAVMDDTGPVSHKPGCLVLRARALREKV